jgi:predicted phosphodiesterase
MKIAVLSDIHGNLEALEAVSVDLDRQRVDRVVSLGDNIGYGPDPEKVVQHIRRKGYESVLGNHEFALMDQRARRWFNFQAAENNKATERLLSPESMVYCRNLPSSLMVAGGHFVHGYPPDSTFRYLYLQSDEKIAALFAKEAACLFFVGHTHKLQLVTIEKGEIVRRRLGRGRVALKAQQKYIINCGSVGQPRDGNHDAKYLVWHVDEKELEVRFVDYAREVTIEKIKDRGFPEVYGLRLR